MTELSLVRLAGDADSPALLVVGPSLGTSVETLWSSCAALLGDHFEVVGWDLPGHGRSAPASRSFSLRDLAAVVRLQATERQAGRPAYYAGDSVGGAVGLELALDPGPFGAVAVLAAGRRIGTPAGWHQRAALVRKEGTASVVAGSRERWFAPGFVDRRPDVAGPLLDALRAADPESYALACEALADFDLAEQDALVPVMMISGAHDPVVPPRPGDHVLAGCGHLPPAEDPAAVAALLSTLFQSAREPR